MDYKYQITVGIPVWGVEKYIRRCLLSILNQDFNDMEVLVIDDCGTDKSIDIAKETLIIIITVAGATPINTYATNGITLTVEGA